MCENTERKHTMPYVIGIAGGTAGGKSTFTDALTIALSPLSVKVLHMDSYYKNEKDRPHVPSHLNGKIYTDDNCPECIDMERFIKDFSKGIESDCDVVIAEGLFVLYTQEIKERLSLKLFVDCPSDERIVRRIRRNAEWGQSFEDVTDVYLNMVRFRHEQYVEPTKWTADLIVNGSGDTELAVSMLAGHVRSVIRKI